MSEAPRPASTCDVTICLTGAIDQTSGSNSGFEALCGRDELVGVVEDCDSGTCYRTHDSFMRSPEGAVYPKLFAALDRDGDGDVDADDPFCDVNILGFSWGGVNAVELARVLSRDGRVSRAQRRVARLLLMDPYQPMAAAKMRVPENVARTRVWRHSKPNPRDCSRVAPLGPYAGMAPLCAAGSDCEDLDYSATPSGPFVDTYGRTWRGDEVGHCSVPLVATPGVLRELESGAAPARARTEWLNSG